MISSSMHLEPNECTVDVISKTEGKGFYQIRINEGMNYVVFCCVNRKEAIAFASKLDMLSRLIHDAVEEHSPLCEMPIPTGPNLAQQ